MLLVGLGNPGAQYAGSRHNVGFMAVQEVLRRHNFSSWREKFSGYYSTGTLAGEATHLLLPQTYMNLSGQAVQAAAHFFKIPVGDIVVVHDELDLPLGKVRLKTGGGHAGHNGLKSIMQLLGSADFRRVRVGIDHPGARELVTPYVLGDFAADEKPKVSSICAGIADIAPALAGGDDMLAQRRITEFLNSAF